jgi:hypothetical protein
VLALLMSWCGCAFDRPTTEVSPDPTSQNQPTRSSSPSPQPQPDPSGQKSAKNTPTAKPNKVYAQHEPFTYRGVTLVIKRVREFQGDTIFEKPSEGKKWLAVEVLVNNQGKENFTITFTEIKLQDRNGNLYNQDLLALSVLDTEFDMVKPGMTLRGEFAFEVPIDANINKVIWDPSHGVCAKKNSLAERYPCQQIPYIIALES